MLDDFQDDDLNNSGEFLDEFRQRLNSQPLENIEERRNQINRSQQIFISTILGIGLAGAVSWFMFSGDYSQTPDAEIPVVRRPQTAIKMQPADPGGIEILNQDKTVYDMIEKNDEREGKVESLLPPPEEPSIPIIEEAVVETPQVANVEEEKAKIELPPASDIKKPVLKETIEEVKTATSKAEAETKVETQPAPEIEKAPAPVVKEVAKQDKQTNDKKAIPNGVWQIQLMSTPNAKAIDKAWLGLKAKYPALNNIPYETEKADLGAKGTFYRLKAGAFMDRGEADKICNTIKNSGGTCLVKKK